MEYDHCGSWSAFIDYLIHLDGIFQLLIVDGTSITPFELNILG